MNGIFFAVFVQEHLNITIAKAGPKTNGRRIFIMDNDFSQRSRAAQMALEDIESEFQEIPRSPDLNPIENIFHQVKRYLENQAISKRITKESFEEFQSRVLRAFDSIPITTIDKGIDAILSSKGCRTKY